MTALPGPPDATLVAGVLAGDRDAFATVYDRYGDRLYDFAHSMLRSPPEAEDAVADAFVIFAERLGQLRDPDRLRPWLYAVVRSECLRRLKARKRFAYDAEELLVDMTDDSATPEQEAQQTALRDLVWDAAAGLADRDRALLDLHLRQGLEGAELGEAMDVTTANAYVMLNRLKAQVERSLGALLIARLGREECDELDAMLADWDGRFSPLIRKRVARHVDHCDVCAARRKVIASPWALLAAVPIVAAPLALRDRIVNDTVLVAMSTTGGSSAGLGSTVASSTLRSRAVLAVASAAAVVLLVVGAVVFWPGSAEEGDPVATPTSPATASTPSPSASPSATPEPTPTPTPPPTASPTAVVAAAGTLTLSTRAVDLGPDGTTATVVLTNTGGQRVDYRLTSGAAWLTASPAAGAVEPGRAVQVQLQADRSSLGEGDAATSLTIVWGTGRSSVDVRLRREIPPIVGAPTWTATSCSLPVTAAASDNGSLRSVTLSWTGPSGAGSAAMSFLRGSWRTTAGPFTTGGPVTMRVTATDDRGNATTGPSTTATVNPCPQ